MGGVDDHGCGEGMGVWKAWAVWMTMADRPRRLDDPPQCIASISPLLSPFIRCEQFLENNPCLPRHASLPHVFSLHCMLVPGRPVVLPVPA